MCMDAEITDRYGFLLRYKEGMAVLIVPPRGERQRQVYADDVMGRMKHWVFLRYRQEEFGKFSSGPAESQRN